MSQYLTCLVVSAVVSFLLTWFGTRYVLRKKIYVGRGTWERQQNRIVELLGQNFKIQAENEVLRGFVTGNGHVRQIDERNDPEAAS